MKDENTRKSILSLMFPCIEKKAKTNSLPCFKHRLEKVMEKIEKHIYMNILKKFKLAECCKNTKEETKRLYSYCPEI